MAKTTFNAIMDTVFEFEGGYTWDAADTGGATNYGVTIGVLSEYRGKKQTPNDVKKLTKSEAKTIFRVRYWDPLRCDEMPKGVDMAIFDFGVNSGIFRSAQYAQRIVGVIADGKIGPISLAALNKIDPKTFINEMCDRRQAFLNAIVASRPSQKVFIKGWTRRVNEVRAKALALV